MSAKLLGAAMVKPLKGRVAAVVKVIRGLPPEDQVAIFRELRADALALLTRNQRCLIEEAQQVAQADPRSPQ